MVSASSHPAITQRTNWLLIGLLLVAGLFAGAQFGKLALTLDEMRAFYSAGAGFVPALVSIVGLVGVAFGAVAGAAVTRFGLNRALLCALGLGGVLSLIEATLPPLGIFAGLRVLEGGSHLAIVVIAPTLMAGAASDGDRPVVMGIWACFFGLSLAVLAAILPDVLARGGLPLLFAGHGLGMILLALVLWPVLPKGNDTSAPWPAYFREHRIIYTTPRLLIPGGGFVWYAMIYIALVAVLPGLLTLPVWVVSGLPVVSILGTFLGGWVAKLMAPDKVVLLGFGLTVLSVPLVIWLPGALWPLFLMFLVMALIPAGSFASIPFFNAQITDKARCTGGLAQLGNVGTSLGTPLFVLVADGGGLVSVALLTSAFCGIGIAVTVALRVRIK